MAGMFHQRDGGGLGARGGGGLEDAMAAMLNFSVQQAQAQSQQNAAMLQAVQAMSKQPGVGDSAFGGASAEARLKGMSRLEALRSRLSSDPASFTKEIRANAETAMLQPGQHVDGARMTAYMTRWMPMAKQTMLSYDQK